MADAEGRAVIRIPRLLMAVLLGTVGMATMPATTSAAWTGLTDPERAGRAAATTMPPGNQPTATVTTPTGASVELTWAASVGEAPVAGYEVRAYDAATGTPRSVGASCDGIVAGTTCTEDDTPDGSWRYSVTPHQQGWTGDESPLSDPVMVDTTPPTVTVTFPVAGGTYGDAAWDDGCASTICGTATDVGSSVASVEVSTRQGSGNYWDGTSFASASEVLVPASGTTSWSLPFPADNFPAEGSYTVRAVSTDFAGNTVSTSTTFTIDRTRPAPTALSLFDANGSVTPGTDEVRITFSEPLNVASICSAWSGTGDESIGGSDVVVTITENLLNDVLTVTAGSCTLHVGSVALGGDYVTATSTFAGDTSATESRVTWTAATQVLTIHIGSQTSGLLNLLSQLAGTVTYTPDSAMTDGAGNGVDATPFTSSSQRL